METTKKPQISLAKKILPRHLYQSLCHVFQQHLQGCGLIGGTALAGFYAGHRRSDDLDFFTQSTLHQEATVLAIKSLNKIGFTLTEPLRTSQFYKAVCQMDAYTFTITAVEDSNLFRIGTFVTLENGICVADLPTLLKTKASTLISRCSEKDLFDLLWLFQEFRDLTFPDLITYAQEIDGGASGETMLLGIAGSILSKNSCGFSLDPKQTAEDIFQKITQFQKEMVKAVSAHLRQQPVPPLGQLVQKLKKLQKS